MNISNIIIIIILILVLVYILSNIFYKSNIIYDIMCDANKSARDVDTGPDITSPISYITNRTNHNVIYNRDINENNTANFMLSVWFYIDNWGNEISNEKNILYIAPNSSAITVPDLQNDNKIGISKRHPSDSVDGYKNINIALDKYENNLLIDIETDPMSVSDGSSNYTRYIVKNISIQKWNNLTISVDTRTMDVYLDGKLRNSFILHGTYKSTMENNAIKNIYLGNIRSPNIGFEGYITRVRFSPHSINPQEAYNIYRDGINSSLANSMFNKYRLKVSFLEYNKERGSFTI